MADPCSPPVSSASVADDHRCDGGASANRGARGHRGATEHRAAAGHAGVAGHLATTGHCANAAMAGPGFTTYPRTAHRLAHAGSLTDSNDPTPLAEAPDAGEITQPVASIVLPQQVLQPGELVILMIKPSVWFILLESLRSLAIIVGVAGLAMLAVRWNMLNLGRSDIILGAGFLGVVRLFWQFLEWLSRLYILTDRRVVRVKGVLRVDIFEAPLKQIQHTNLLISFRQRVTGLGTVTFTTAGTGLIDAAWTYVADPVQVHQTVLRVLQRYR